MSKVFLGRLGLGGLLGLMTFQLVALQGKSIFVPRSQQFDSVRTFALWTPLLDVPQEDTPSWGTFLAPTYTRSFAESDLAQYLFGTQCVTFSGSQVPDRGPNDVLADYFGLPTTFESIVHFAPRISNFIFDWGWFVSLNYFNCNGYLFIHTPIVHSKWDVHLKECVAATGTEYTDTINDTTFAVPAGYFSPAALARADIPADVHEAFLGVRTFGDYQEQLQYGKIFGREERNGVADITVDIGSYFLNRPRYGLAAALIVTAPTGNRPNAEFLFDAVVGNGHHWELGGSLIGRFELLVNQERSRSLGAYVSARITHMFADTQCRSYDLINGLGSRYMLVETMGTPARNLQVSAVGPAASNQYTGLIMNAINVTTLQSDIHIRMQADILFMLAYNVCGIEIEGGYNFWARSKERIKCRARIPDGRYALKGDAQLYGFTAAQIPIALNATQNSATLHAGQGVGNFVSGVQFANRNADNSTLAYDGAGGTLSQLLAVDATAMSIPVVQASLSNPAILITDAMIDESSALAPRGLSHKLFFNAGYCWFDAPCYTTFIGGGAEAEFGKISSQESLCSNSCNTTRHASLSQWSMYIKLGLVY